jgi:hypothetical protein
MNIRAFDEFGAFLRAGVSLATVTLAHLRLSLTCECHDSLATVKLAHLFLVPVLFLWTGRGVGQKRSLGLPTSW